MTKTEKIYIAGHNGMVGSAIHRQIIKMGTPSENIIGRTRNELDLTNQQQVISFFQEERPTQVYLTAAKVGGIHANNTEPADFIYQNIAIQNNIIHSAFISGVKKLMFLGSSCIYPKNASQPIPESALLTGKLESTNEPYAIAKIAGIKLCESFNRQYGNSHGIDYRSVMPCNLFGPGDNYDLEKSHVIPALILKFHKAKINNEKVVIVWGTGTPRREFLYVDDLADACVFLMNLNKNIYRDQTTPMQSHINIGNGKDITISDLANSISRIVGYEGEIKFDSSKPDGTKQKLMNSKLLNSLGWRPSIGLAEGLKLTYENFQKINQNGAKLNG